VIGATRTVARRVAAQAAPAVSVPRGAGTSRAPRGALTTAIASGPTGPGVARA